MNKPLLRALQMLLFFGQLKPRRSYKLGSYKKKSVIPENQRICYCDSGEVESEYYVLFKCSMYNKQRRSWLNKLLLPANFLDLNETEKLKLVLNRPENVRHTAQYLVSVMDFRCQMNKVY